MEVYVILNCASFGGGTRKCKMQNAKLKIVVYVILTCPCPKGAMNEEFSNWDSRKPQSQKLQRSDKKTKN